MKKALISLVLVIVLAGIVYCLYLLVVSPEVLSNIPSVISSQVDNTTNKTQPVIGQVKEPETSTDMQQALDFAKSQNKDTVGWLMIPNSKINYGIMQSNNNIYYLANNDKKQPDTYGSCFADYECSIGTREEMSVNTIIYGHSDLKDNPEGPKFSQLFKFAEEQYAKNTPYLYFSTIEEQMVWEIFAVSYTDTRMEYVYPHIEPKAQQALVKEAKSKSIYEYNVDVSEDDKILTLSTCTVKYGASKEQRLIIMAKLLLADAVEKPVANLTVNPNPVQPKL